MKELILGRWVSCEVFDGELQPRFQVFPPLHLRIDVRPISHRVRRALLPCVRSSVLAENNAPCLKEPQFYIEHLPQTAHKVRASDTNGKNQRQRRTHQLTQECIFAQVRPSERACVLHWQKIAPLPLRPTVGGQGL